MHARILQAHQMSQIAGRFSAFSPHADDWREEKPIALASPFHVPVPEGYRRVSLSYDILVEGAQFQKRIRCHVPEKREVQQRSQARQGAID